MSNGVMPELGNLAWAPLAAVEEVEIFDRYNGVPTLGVFRSQGETHMYWRAAGYTGDISLWLYVSLTGEDERNVEDDEGAGLLDGIVFRSPRNRYATVGVADGNRLVFEREWDLPSNLRQGEVLKPLIEFTSECLRVALEQDLPSSRREIFQKAETAVRHLVDC